MKKIRQIIQQLNPFGEHLDSEKPAVALHPEQPPLMEPVKVGEAVEAMIQEEYLSRQAEVNSRNGEDTVDIVNQPSDTFELEQDTSIPLQQEESIIAPDLNAPEEESIDSAINLLPEDENPEKVQIAEEAVTIAEKEIESEISTTEEPIRESSLSDNKPFVKLAEECAGLMNEFDGYAERLETEEGKMMTEMVVKRLQELLERVGLERIDNETEFSVLRHSPIPMQLVKEGTPIVQTRFPGLVLGNRVYRKATVIVDLSDKKQNNDQHEM